MEGYHLCDSEYRFMQVVWAAAQRLWRELPRFLQAQAGRLSVGRVRSPAAKFYYSAQEPVEHFAHIRYTGPAFLC